MKIIVADDHSIVRKGIQLIVEEHFPESEIDEANNGDDLLDKIKLKNYQLVILDISMPGRDTLDTLRTLKRMYPNLPVLMFSMNPEKAFAIRMLKAGANGYISKDCSQDELVEAIKLVSSGKGYITSTVTELLANEIREGSEKLPHEKLTDREFQIMLMIAEGFTLDEIAQKLFLSKNTVSNHRNNILKKLELRNNSEVTIYAIKNDLIS